MIVSLNEIEQTVLKAARGAGRSWGEAEDIAAAARWLALHHAHLQSWNWLASLVAALGSDRDTLSAVNRSALLSDPDALTNGPQLFRFRDPIWLAAFAAPHAIGTACAFMLTWTESCIAVDAKGTLSVAVGDVVPAHAVDVVIHVSDPTPYAFAMPPCQPGGRAVDAALWQHLNRWESRTTVPASDRSRQSGAGATTSDND